jgi:Nucleoside transporter
VTIFNVFDTVGRYFGGIEAFTIQNKWVNYNSYARVVFIATFLLTDFVAPPTWLWDADWFKITNLVLFAFSNGYIGTLCAVKAPGTVEESRRA